MYVDHRRGGSFSWNTIIWLGFPLLTAIVVLGALICSCTAYLTAYFNSKKVGPIGRNPIVPEWMRIQYPTRIDSSYLIPHVRVQCRPYSVLYRKHGYEEPKHCIYRMRNVMRRMFGAARNGRPTVAIPDDACLISVKMDNFKYGEQCTDFEPIDGAAAGSYYVYQMFGDDRIQVTYYVEAGVAYVAGFCVYISSPYLWSARYKEQVMWKCWSAPKLPRKPQRSSQHLLTDISNVSESLRVNQCKKLKRAVMIGPGPPGKVMHYEWNEALNTYKVTDCASCSSAEQPDAPPRYSSLLL
ncbi:unnamed protein product [Caenorhabditis sp. 36 PRJEB53466]|nr:unnamed protein product [Caenorhabditis sp. 36 PRJEB53466]